METEKNKIAEALPEKEAYEPLEIEIIEFDNGDIITSSPRGDADTPWVP